MLLENTFSQDLQEDLAQGASLLPQVQQSPLYVSPRALGTLTSLSWAPGAPLVAPAEYVPAEKMASSEEQNKYDYSYLFYQIARGDFYNIL